MESIIWKQLGSHMKFLALDHINLYLVCISSTTTEKYQGSLGRGLRRGQPVARAQSAQQCGQRCHADRLGVSYLGLAGWIRSSCSGALIPF